MAYTQHEPCPRCGSKDNLARYEDGSGWCFGCRYYEPPQGLQRLRNFVGSTQLKTKWENLSLPIDASYRLKEEHLAWLNKYDLTRSEIIKYRMMSSEQQGLILPIFNSKEELLFYVNRPMREGAPESKDNGLKPFVVFKSKEPTSDTIVCVEDYISAVKVSRVVPAQPLFGSFLSVGNITKLRKKYKHLLIWLDRDKAKESIRQATRCRSFFTSVRSVITDLDPKEYSTEEIRKWLNL